MTTQVASATRNRDWPRRTRPEVSSPAGEWIPREQSVRGFTEREFHAAALELLDQNEAGKGKVLELGCGVGHFTDALARRGFRVDAVDRVEAVVRSARDRICGNAAVSVTVQDDAIGTSHFENSTFDVVVALRSLPWLSEPFRLVDEVTRVLKPGGMLVLAARNRNSLRDIMDPATSPLAHHARSLWSWLASGLNGRPGFRPEFPRTHSRREVAELLESRGFAIVKERSVGIGSLTMFGCHLVPDSIGVRIAQWFHWCAARGVPLLKGAGVHMIVLATRRKETRGGSYENTHE